MEKEFKEDVILALKHKESSDNREVISLFSGAMGLDIGLSQAGLNIAIGQDFDNCCVSTMKANGHRAVGGDIRTIEPQELLSAAQMEQGEPFLICGGPPCQPFSTAGKRLGINDPRGSLFMDFIRMIDYIRPRFFIMENVKGLMSSSTSNGKNDEQHNMFSINKFSNSALDVILSEFDKLGYKTVYGMLDAVNYGAPQFRERFALIGSRDKEDIFLPMPTHFQTHQEPSYQWVTLRSAIEKYEKDYGDCASFSADRLNFLKLVPEGGNWRDLPDNLVESAMGGAYKSGGGKVGFYRRLSYDQPCPTLVTSPVQKASMLCHPTQDRPLSVNEYAAIQQFPEQWAFAGSMMAKYKQIGNAVPTGLATALGKAILSTANGSSTIKTKRIRGTAVHTKIKNAIEMGNSDAY
jgi:DNA (cytosine-5)-methyltransferase 1